VLLPPESTVEEGGNPYLQLANLKQVVDVTMRALSSQEAVDAVAAEAPSGTYEILPDYETSGPIFIITADDKTPTATLATLEAVKDKVAPTLANLQNALAITPNSQITSKIVTTDSKPTTVRKVQIRALIAALGVGLALSALAIGLIDSFLIRRGRRRHPDSSAVELVNMNARTISSISSHTPSELSGPRTRRMGLTRAMAIPETVQGEVEPFHTRARP
jgi:hypothetical protein